MCVHVYARGQQASTMSIEVEGVVVCHIVSHSHCVCVSMCVCVAVCGVKTLKIGSSTSPS